MKTTSDNELPQRATPSAPARGNYPMGHWIAAVCAIVALLLVYLPTTLGIIETWNSSASYSHGYLVLPVSAWLLWRGRGNFATVAWQPWWPALLGLAVLAALWFFGHLTNIKSFRDLALVASIPLTLITVLGKDFARRAVFPLIFIIFAWPFGEVFIPRLVDLTADFTVVALRLTGVPVYRDGNNFVIPSGEWSVVQECSGVNYLLVSLFAGSLFGYLNFRSNRRRWVFLALALVVPILANWLRAYGIVLLGHFTNNKLATGVDHLIYGWLFFGIVMTGLFYFALRFMGESPAVPSPDPKPLVSGDRTRIRTAWIAGGAAIALSAIAPIAAARLDAIAQSVGNQTMDTLPVSLGGWSISRDLELGWKAPFEHATSNQRVVFRRADDLVEVHLAWYAADSGTSKLTRFEGATRAEFDPTWRIKTRTDLRVKSLSPELRVVEREIHSRGMQLLVWQWALIGGIEASGFVDSKLALARARLSGRGSDSTGVALATPVQGENVAGARAQLQNLANELRPWLDLELRGGRTP